MGKKLTNLGKVLLDKYNKNTPNCSTCVTCKWYAPQANCTFGRCANITKISREVCHDNGEEDNPNDALEVEGEVEDCHCEDSYTNSSIYIGENFGCIHHVARDTKEWRTK